MTTQTILKARVASELRRSDLTAQIASAISTAISAYQGERWMFGERRNVTFPTIAAQEFYATTDNAALPLIRKIDYVTLLVGSTQTTLDPMSPEDIEVSSANATSTGQPSSYCYYQEQFRLYPVPDSVWTVRVAGLYALAEPATDAETGNAWMLRGERLIRSRAKWEIAKHVLRDAKLASDMAEATQEAWRDLKAQTNQLTGTGRVQASTF